MHCEAKVGVAAKHLQKWAITAGVRIRQYFRKIADWLMSMNTEEQTDGWRHQAISRNNTEEGCLLKRESKRGNLIRGDMTANPRQLCCGHESTSHPLIKRRNPDRPTLRVIANRNILLEPPRGLPLGTTSIFVPRMRPSPQVQISPGESLSRKPIADSPVANSSACCSS
jgi:hypothetical protein